LTGLKALWILIVVMLLLGAFAVAYLYYPEAEESLVNVCLHWEDYDPQNTMPYLVDLGVGWVRTDWLLTPDNPMRNYSQDLQDHNIKLLAIIDHKTFDYQIPTLEEWKETITEIVTSEDFRNVDAVEIWNEPNSDAFDSYIEPDVYFEMLKSAYAIIKEHTNIPVVFAGVSPNVEGWQTYLNAVFAHNDTQDYFDYMGLHFYDGNMTTNLDTLEFVESLTSKPIWLTETGQPSATGDYTEAKQAEYLSSVYSTFEPLVSKIFIYELRDGNGETVPERENYFGLLTFEETKKPAYDIVWNISRNQENK